MSKKPETKKASPKIFIFLGIIVLAAIVFGIFFLLPPKHFTIGFYKISDKQRQGITSIIEKIADEKGFTVVFTQYDPTKSLKDQLVLKKKPNVIFTLSGFAVNEAIEKSSPRAFVGTNLAAGMTSSIRSALILDEKNNQRVKALPLLSSHFETDIDTQEFRNSEIKQINTWTDVEKFMREQKRKKEAPMIIAGGDNDMFLNFIGAFSESVDGASAYSDAAKILKDSTKSFNAARTAIKLCDEPNSPLANSIKLLKAWYAQGLIHQGSFSLKMNDVEAFASSRLSSVLFMSLENHREVAQNTISRFTSIYFPSEIGANSRVFTGNLYYAVPLANSKSTQSLLESLVLPENQEALSRSTGLAPVLSQCRTPDRQSDDARYWIAATTAPLPGLANEVFFTTEQKNQLSAEIASRIKN